MLDSNSLRGISTITVSNKGGSIHQIGIRISMIFDGMGNTARTRTGIGIRIKVRVRIVSVSIWIVIRLLKLLGTVRCPIVRQVLTVIILVIVILIRIVMLAVKLSLIFYCVFSK